MTELTIEAAGARTSVGESLEETAISIELGIQRAVRGPFVGAGGVRQRISPVALCGPEHRGLERACWLAFPALKDCVTRLVKRGVSMAEPVLLAVCLDLPPSRRDDELGALADAVRAVANARAGVVPYLQEAMWRAGFTDVETVVMHAGDADPSLLAHASRALGGRHRRVMWGGVSSACESPWIDWLMVRDASRAPRFRAPLCVGEAAVFVCVSLAQREGPRIVGWTEGVDAAVQQGRATTAEVTTSLLEAAMDTIATRVRGAPLALLDFPDNRALATEWQMSVMRVLGARGIVPETRSPSLSIGAVGAATLPLYIALMGEWLRDGQGGICAVLNDLPRRALVSMYRENRSHT